MNGKTAKLIRKKVSQTHGVEKDNPQFKKICGIVKDEFYELNRKQKSSFKKSGI